MLLFIRHAPTIWNAGYGIERHRAWADDIPLAPGWEAEVDQVVEMVAALPIEIIFTAPEYRCKVVAQRLVNVTGIRALITRALQSWNIGYLTGQLVATTKKEMAYFMFDHPNEPVPGGEAFNEFTARVLNLVKTLWKRKELIVMIGHGRPSMVSNAWANAGARPDERLAVDDLSIKANLIEPGQAGVLAPGIPWTDLGINAGR